MLLRSEGRGEDYPHLEAQQQEDNQQQDNGPWLKRTSRRVARWFLGFHGSPRQVARGMAIGVFVAFSPTLGFQMAIAVILATLTYSSRAAAAAAVWITNPLTALPLYLMTFKIGRYCIPNPEPVNVRKRLSSVIYDEQGEWLDIEQQLHEVASLGTEVLVPLSIGGVILGGALAIVAYFVTKLICERAVHWIQHRREERQEMLAE